MTVKCSLTKRLNAVAVLLLLSTPAVAEWTFLGSGDNGDKIFLDKETLKKDGDRRRIWVLMDMKGPSKSGVRSSKDLWEFDCTEERYQVLDGMSYRGQMGRGEIARRNVHFWVYAAPDSVGGVLLKVVCAE